MDPVMLSKVLKHYKRVEVQKAIVANAVNKEISGSFGGKGYSKRPDVLQFPSDVFEMVKKGVTSFHASEELWRNVLMVKTGASRQEMNELRIGWDLVLDIDCKFLEYSALAAHLLIQALKYQGIQSVTCKFSGNHGFHIGVPFEAFPEKVHGEETRTLFPEGPRKIAEYLKEMISEHLAREILLLDGLEGVKKKCEKDNKDIIVNGKFNPFSILEVDTILISSRHLCRMVYSLNEKSGLVSVPIDPEKVLEFDKKMADVSLVEVTEWKFMDRNNVVSGEAADLIVKSFDFAAEIEEKKQKITKDERVFQYEKKLGDVKLDEITVKIPEQLFPPCIQKIKKGLEDGKKRAIFILINFLASCNWSYDDIEEYLVEWNKNNKESLREVYWKGQLRYARMHNKKILPPNCDNKMYYKDLQICCPDNVCTKTKNPVNYAVRKMRFLSMQKGKRKKKTNFDKNKKNKNKSEDKSTNSSKKSDNDCENNNSKDKVNSYKDKINDSETNQTTDSKVSKKEVESFEEDRV